MHIVSYFPPSLFNGFGKLFFVVGYANTQYDPGCIRIASRTSFRAFNWIRDGDIMSSVGSYRETKNTLRRKRRVPTFRFRASFDPQVGFARQVDATDVSRIVSGNDAFRRSVKVLQECSAKFYAAR